MYWVEDIEPGCKLTSEKVVDVAFDLKCPLLPVDHAYALAEEILVKFPNFAEVGGAIHRIHSADSGNGWYSPEEIGEFLYPSRRNKLVLRLPYTAMNGVIEALTNKTLFVAGYSLALGTAKIRPLISYHTLYARYMIREAADEMAFLANIQTQLEPLGIVAKKLIGGKTHSVKTPQGIMTTQSLMVADLIPKDSLTLQEHGLGCHFMLGCGIFIGHKDVQKL